MTYVDGFVVPVPQDKLDEYLKIAIEACKVWKEYGALDYKECIIDDDNIQGLRSFAETADIKKGETVILAYVVYKSREHRDEVNKKAMADPRICAFSPENMPFDCKRMAWGGFKAIVGD